LPADGITTALLVFLNDAFFNQHVNDAVRRRTGEAGRLHDLTEWDAFFTAGRKNTQHGQRSPDGLRSLSRLLSDPV
jgi:hypothetical protein